MSTKTILRNILPCKAEWSMPLPLNGKLVSILSAGHEYTTEDCDCRYCLHFSEKTRKCETDNCVCLPERLRAGCVSADELYGRFLAESGIGMDSAKPKRTYRRDVVKTLFVSDDHHDRWRGLMKSKTLSKQSSPAFAAALFLLAADSFLWNRAKNHIGYDSIRFRDIDIRGVDTNGYAIFKAAKAMYTGEQHIRFSELADPNLASDSLLRLIINATFIRRHGVRAVKS